MLDICKTLQESMGRGALKRNMLLKTQSLYVTDGAELYPNKGTFQ